MSYNWITNHAWLLFISVSTDRSRKHWTYSYGYRIKTGFVSLRTYGLYCGSCTQQNEPEREKRACLRPCCVFCLPCYAGSHQHFCDMQMTFILMWPLATHTIAHLACGPTTTPSRCAFGAFALVVSRCLILQSSSCKVHEKSLNPYAKHEWEALNTEKQKIHVWACCHSSLEYAARATVTSRIF